ncbi:lipocalin-like domain-containing protein [Dysgonomonas sp. 520]|uniref:lipocalin-like domain-containing protein n=1 Tax=Dysgonomonas sp. 520 TaxID=2302931 RepID=UPI0013D66E33|nr:lipocalin-like domain-containing protein [Dysgonomonas sp. 520]NDW09172.1 hypothetical protein [Dysgonomonas sp. 520]
MKNTPYIYLLILAFCSCFFVSCEDYEYTEIEKQWQLREKKINDQTIPVDTVFYSFRKGVFRHLLLTSETTSVESFGVYNKDGNSLQIELKTREVYVDWDENTRSFQIEKLNGSDLIMEYNDTTYIFRKY